MVSHDTCVIIWNSKIHTLRLVSSVAGTEANLSAVYQPLNPPFVRRKNIHALNFKKIVQKSKRHAVRIAGVSDPRGGGGE